MSNEFIARKGLIAYKSSSFHETLHADGVISSPVVAELTASWSNNSISASYALSASFTTSASYSSVALNGGVGNLTGRYTFNVSTVSGDPGDGQLAYNSTDSGSVTEIYISQTTSPGVDAGNFLHLLKVGDVIYSQQQDTSDIWIMGVVSSLPIDNGGWWTIPFQFSKGGAGGIPDNKKDAMLITMVPQTTAGTFSGSFVGNLTGTASFAISASHAIFSDTASYVNVARTASYVDFTNVANKPTLVSSSAQVLVGSGVYSSSAQLPSGLVSSSAQVVASLPAGTVSSSAQVLVGSGVYSSSAQLPAGLVSSSAQTVANIAGQQISPSGITSSLLGTASTASYVLLAQTASYVALAQTASYVDVARTASYVTFQNIANKPTLVSSSAQLENAGGLAFSGASNVTFGQITASVINAQTLIITTVSSSVVYSSGSNRFGSVITNVQEFTGSVRMTGSLTVVGPITGTASYALQAETASFIQRSRINTLGVVSSAKTGSFVCSAGGTWFDITSDNELVTSSYWIHPTASGQFTCSQDGWYNVNLSVTLQRTSGASGGAIRVTRNGVQISGSYASYLFTANNAPQTLVSNFTTFFTSSSLVNVQVAGVNGGNIQVIAPLAVGTGQYIHSSLVSITML